LKPNEALRFRVNGQEIVPADPVLWSDDKEPHRVDLGTRMKTTVPPSEPESQDGE